MLKRITKLINKMSDNLSGSPKKGDKDLLSLELAEIREISDVIFRRLEKKIEVLEAIEASVDEKVALLEKLINRVEAIKFPSDISNREFEIIQLSAKGLKIDEIARILDIPAGEVDLILNLSSKRA